MNTTTSATNVEEDGDLYRTNSKIKRTKLKRLTLTNELFEPLFLVILADIETWEVLPQNSPILSEDSLS